MKISQREAHRLKKRVAELERNRSEMLNLWAEFPGGVNIATLIELSPRQYAQIETAQKLGFTLIAKSWNMNQVSIYAVKS